MSASPPSNSTITTMSLNIRNSNPRNPENNAKSNPHLHACASWIHRKNVLTNFLLSPPAPHSITSTHTTPCHTRNNTTTTTHHFDILALQEVLPDQYTHLHQNLSSKYTLYSVPREDGMQTGEACTIGYLTNRFVELDRGTFWISPEPHRIGSKFRGACCVRICSWVKLQVRSESSTGGEVLVVANAHLDHVSEEARTYGCQTLTEQLGFISGGGVLPTLLLGDFNFVQEKEEGYEYLLSSSSSSEDKAAIPRGRWRDSYVDIHGSASLEDDHHESVTGFCGNGSRSCPISERSTFHDFGRSHEGLRIDYIFYTDGDFEVKDSVIVSDEGEPVWISDHYPLVSTFVLLDRSDRKHDDGDRKQ